MSYCGTLDVYYASQVVYNQFRSMFGTTSAAVYENWIAGTLIPQAQGIIDHYCGHSFGSISGTLLLDGNGKQWLPITREGLVDSGSGYENMELLPIPLISISSVEDDGTAITDYYMYHSYLKRDSGVFRNDEQNIKIICSWGYTAVPDEIRYVTARVCANVIGEMLRMRNLPDIVKSVMDGATSVSPLFYNPVSLTKDERMILTKYRYKEIQVA